LKVRDLIQRAFSARDSRFWFCLNVIGGPNRAHYGEVAALVTPRSFSRQSLVWKLEQIRCLVLLNHHANDLNGWSEVWWNVILNSEARGFTDTLPAQTEQQKQHHRQSRSTKQQLSEPFHAARNSRNGTRTTQDREQPILILSDWSVIPSLPENLEARC